MVLANVIFRGVGLVLIAVSSITGHAESARPVLNVLTYDTLVAKKGWATQIKAEFEKTCSCEVRFVAQGSAGQMVNRLELDGRAKVPRRSADVVLGADQFLWPRVRPYVLAKSPVPQLSVVDSPLVVAIRPLLKGLLAEGFVPFNYGIFAWMSDQRRLKELKLAPPQKFADLLRPEWEKKILLQDPRTSSPGLAFLIYTQMLDPAGAPGLWVKLRKQWLTLAPGWDEAYGLFLKQEAPLVWSYTTSQAYHRESGDVENRYQAIVLAEGQPMQVEGGALLKGVEADPVRLRLANEFLAFLVSPSAQALIPQSQWMLPVREGVKLPESFANLPSPSRLYLWGADSGENSQTNNPNPSELLKNWIQWIRQ